MLGSPVYGHLAGRLAEDPRPARRDPRRRGIVGSRSAPLRRGPLPRAHRGRPAALSGEWDDFAAALAAHEASLRAVRPRAGRADERDPALRRARARVPHRRPRTGLPLDLIELGPSAGLNLVFDRYGYRYAEGTFGDPDARLAFDAVERGRVPAALLETPIEVNSRARHRPRADRRHGSRRRRAAARASSGPGLDERVARLDAAIETFLATPNRPDPDPGRLRRPAARPARRSRRGSAHGRLPDRLDRLPDARALRRAPRVARQRRGRRPPAGARLVAPP